MSVAVALHLRRVIIYREKEEVILKRIQLLYSYFYFKSNLHVETPSTLLATAGQPIISHKGYQVESQSDKELVINGPTQEPALGPKLTKHNCPVTQS